MAGGDPMRVAAADVRRAHQQKLRQIEEQHKVIDTMKHEVDSMLQTVEQWKKEATAIEAQVAGLEKQARQMDEIEQKQKDMTKNM